MDGSISSEAFGTQDLVGVLSQIDRSGSAVAGPHPAAVGGWPPLEPDCGDAVHQHQHDPPLEGPLSAGRSGGVCWNRDAAGRSSSSTGGQPWWSAG